MLFIIIKPPEYLRQVLTCYTCLLHDIQTLVLLPYFGSWLATRCNAAESELGFLSLLGSDLSQNGSLSQKGNLVQV